MCSEDERRGRCVQPRAKAAFGKGWLTQEALASGLAFSCCCFWLGVFGPCQRWRAGKALWSQVDWLPRCRQPLRLLARGTGCEVQMCPSSPWACSSRPFHLPLFCPLILTSPCIPRGVSYKISCPCKWENPVSKRPGVWAWGPHWKPSSVGQGEDLSGLKSTDPALCLQMKPHLNSGRL